MHIIHMDRSLICDTTIKSTPLILHWNVKFESRKRDWEHLSTLIIKPFNEHQ